MAKKEAQQLLPFAGGKLPHYSIVCFPRRPLLRVETDKAGSVLSGLQRKGLARDTCTDVSHIGDLDTGGQPALTCSLWMMISLTIMMLMRFPTLGSLYTAATCNKDKTHRQKMQTSTNLSQSTVYQS